MPSESEGLTAYRYGSTTEILSQLSAKNNNRFADLHVCLFKKQETRSREFPVYDPYGIRTHVTAVKGRCLNHLTNGPYIKGAVETLRLFW